MTHPSNPTAPFTEAELNELWATFGIASVIRRHLAGGA
jgi:hypothetical protein